MLTFCQEPFANYFNGKKYNKWAGGYGPAKLFVYCQKPNRNTGKRKNCVQK